MKSPMKSHVHRPSSLVLLVLGALSTTAAAGVEPLQNRGGQEPSAEKARGQQKPAQREQPDQARDRAQQGREQAQKGREQAESAREGAAERGKQPPVTEREAAGRETAEREGAGRGNSRWAGRSKEDVARFKRFLAEEAKHRQRLARIERLRELARKSNSADRVAKLKELEAVEATRYGEAMNRFRSEMGDEDFRDAKAFVERFGSARGRQKLDDMRERAKDQRGEAETKRPGAGG